MLALGGGAYAAGKLVIKGKQIKDGSVAGVDIKNDSLTGDDIDESSLGSSSGGISRVNGPEAPLGTSGDARVNSSIAFCPSGQRVISGGFATITGDAETAASDANNDRSAWFVVAANHAVISGTTQAIAYCASTDAAVRATSDRGAVRAEVEALEARVRAAQG